MSIACKKTGVDPTLYLTRSSTHELVVDGDLKVTGDVEVGGSISQGTNFRICRSSQAGWTTLDDDENLFDGVTLAAPQSWDDNPTSSNGWDSTNFWYVCPVSGKYRVSINGWLYNSGAATQVVKLYLYDSNDDQVNILGTLDVTINDSIPLSSGPGGDYDYISYSTIIYMKKTDKLKLLAGSTGGANWYQVDLSGELITTESDTWRD